MSLAIPAQATAPFQSHLRPQHPPRHTTPVQFISPNHKALTSRSFWDVLATTGSALNFLSGFVLLGMPLITKHPQAVLRPFTKFLSPLKQQQWKTWLGNRAHLETQMKRLTQVFILLQGINLYQQAVNSKQPSLFLHTLGRDAIQLSLIRKWNPYVNSLYWVIGTLYYMGKRDDIENNNHPERRREWPIERLTRHLPWHHEVHPIFMGEQKSSAKEDIKSFLRFFKDDIQLTLPSQAWNDLKNDLQKPEFWKTPQKSFLNIGIYTALTGVFLNIVGLSSKKSVFSLIASVLIMAGGTIASIPIIVRGWQNRSELDGKMVFIGRPLENLGELFAPAFTTRFYFLNGISKLGGSMNVKGQDLNSKRYRAWTEEIVWLAALAQQRSDITARTILDHFQSDTDDRRVLEKRLGKFRFHYLMTLLEKAETQAHKGVTLAQFLSTALPKAS